ncbi:TPA: polysaccharide biosynthesis protein, partial [Enterobacter hormaechei subsp. xiangfangensis]|nr:polysaccharide biosynthesis protein [Enterobacter hormaechei subsp. xiangfangensis]
MKYQFFWSFTPKIYELLLNLTIGIAVINYLGPTEQGKIGFLINLCMLLSFLTTLGIGPVFSNFVSRSNNNNLISGKFKDSISLR